MLSAEENKTITQVGPGTPMGELFRRYWLPAMLSEELPEPDCAPVKLRLLGEDLLAFRTTSGAVGVIDTWCPHRNANLYWGRNEEEGLRCVYHGWKFNTEGQCIDMPNEPPTSRFAEKIRITAYQAVERGGVIWIHMGPKELAPKIPDLEWTLVPASHRVVSKRIQFCNYLQNLEGEVDSSHAMFLHSTIGPKGGPARPDRPSEDLHAVFSILETDYGLAICARRDAGPDDYYWRITPFMLPTYTIIPGKYNDSWTFTGAVPIDDTTMVGITAIWSPDHEISGRPFVDVDEKYFPLQNKANEYLIDRQEQKTKSYTGIKGVRVQDIAVQEDQKGPISDRTTEHLGTSDAGVITTRQRLLRQAQGIQRGEEPTQPSNPAAYYVRSMGLTAPRDVPWEQLMAEHMPIKGNPAVHA